MKKFLMFLAAAAAVTSAVSCEETNTGYEGTNYIMLSSESNSMFDTDNNTLAVTVSLTTSLEENLNLTLSIEDNDYVSLENELVTIPAGSLTAVVTVKVLKNLPESEASMNFFITLDASTALPEKVVWSDNYTFTLLSSYIPALTEDQKTIVENYKSETGIDLNKYLGLIPVTTVYTAASIDSEIPLAPVTINGYTKITLSEQSTADQPVLKMIVNPMGLQDVLYDKLKSLTVDNTSWYDEYASPDFKTLLDAIGLTSTSVETFSMSLDGIKPKTDGTVEFVADLSYYDEEWDETVEMFKVPFEFYYSAYEREKEQLEQGNIGTEQNPEWYYEATVNPDSHLNTETIATDEFETGNYVQASASISNESMVFTFPIYNSIESSYDMDYSKVVATYTPNE